MTNEPLLVNRLVEGESLDSVLDEALDEGRFGDTLKQVGPKSKQLCRMMAEFFYVNYEELDTECVIAALTQVIRAGRIGGGRGAALTAGANLLMHAMNRHMGRARRAKRIVDRRAQIAATKGTSGKASAKKKARTRKRPPTAKKKTVRKR
jgi:hypothetical protein